MSGATRLASSRACATGTPGLSRPMNGRRLPQWGAIFRSSGGKRSTFGPRELLRVRKRQRAEEQRVDHAEDGDIGSNGQRQDEDGDGGEAGIAAQRAKKIACVLNRVVPIILQAFAAFHFLSDADTDLLY